MTRCCSNINENEFRKQITYLARKDYEYFKAEYEDHKFPNYLILMKQRINSFPFLVIGQIRFE